MNIVLYSFNVVGDYTVSSKEWDSTAFEFSFPVLTIFLFSDMNNLDRFYIVWICQYMTGYASIFLWWEMTAQVVLSATTQRIVLFALAYLVLVLFALSCIFIFKFYYSKNWNIIFANQREYWHKNMLVRDQPFEKGKNTQEEKSFRLLEKHLLNLSKRKDWYKNMWV